MYSSGKQVNNSYSRTAAVIGEPDIRDEIHKIVVTENRGPVFIYRRVRRDEKGLPILSPSRQSNRSREISMDIPSNVSDSMGYLFDDYGMRGYLDLTLPDHYPGRIQGAGDSRNENKVLILEYDCLYKITGSKTDMPDEKDQIIIPKTDIEGVVLSPLQVSEIYYVSTVEAFRLDGNGRIEYYKLNLTSKPEKSYKV